MNWLDRSREDSKDEHMHLVDAVLESVMVFRLAARAMAEVVVPLDLAKAGFLSGCTVDWASLLRPRSVPSSFMRALARTALL